MSTALYMVRNLEASPRTSRVRLRLFVVYFEWTGRRLEVMTLPPPRDKTFFLREFCRRSQALTFTDEISENDLLDDAWTKRNAGSFIKDVKFLCSRNDPFTRTLARLHEDAQLVRAEPPAGADDVVWSGDEERLLQGDYDVWLRDPRWIETFPPVGTTWSTTSYSSPSRR